MVGRAVLLVCAMAMACVAWSRGVGGPYLFDDFTTPMNDPASQSLSAWVDHLRPTLRPLTKLTYAIEASIGWADRPAPRRAVSLVLQGGTALLLWLLVRRLAPTLPSLGAAALAGLWFVHPVHADGVLMVSGRTTVLSNLFILAALLALDRGWRWMAALFFAAACFSRETAVAALLPLAVLAATRHPSRWREALRELTPMLIAAGIALVWLVATPRYTALAEYSMVGRPIALSAMRQVSAVPVGLGLLLMPASLSIDYGIPLAETASHPLFWLGLLMYVGAAVGVIVGVRRHPATAVGLALWLAALLPTQSIVPKLDALANRPLSLALAGLLLAIAPEISALMGRARWRTVAATVAAAAIFTVLATETAARASLFQSPLAVWKDAADKSRVNERPHVNYALLLQEHGRNREALQELMIAAKIDPFSSRIDSMLRALQSREASR